YKLIEPTKIFSGVLFKEIPHTFLYEASIPLSYHTTFPSNNFELLEQRKVDLPECDDED
ncbi:hypothetical protein LSTR_LSTR015501, partial [Laodelphax striatellus]